MKLEKSLLVQLGNRAQNFPYEQKTKFVLLTGPAHMKRPLQLQGDNTVSGNIAVGLLKFFSVKDRLASWKQQYRHNGFLFPSIAAYMYTFNNIYV